VIRALGPLTPAVGPGVFVADDATVIGDVALGRDSSVWYGCVVRGDVNAIRVGPETNIQDLSVVHVATDRFATTIGARVTVGHRAILHGCTVGDGCLIGMGAILLDGCELGEGAMVAAGALVTPGTRIPPGMLAMGSPARVVRAVSDEERRTIAWSAAHYVELGRQHAAAAR
jgi:carbonic anhydrase/acetyltransferase-like protein (isoleucine patch superfamily)